MNMVLVAINYTPPCFTACKRLRDGGATERSSQNYERDLAPAVVFASFGYE